MSQDNQSDAPADVGWLKKSDKDNRDLIIGDGSSGFIARITRQEEKVRSAEKDIADLHRKIEGDGSGSGLDPRLNKLEERTRWADQKIDDVDSMVHGDGSNSGLIAHVNTLESQVKFLLFLLPIVAALGGTVVVAAAIYVSNVLID